MTHYTVRYRTSDARGRIVLIVEDAAGTACLFCGGEFQACLAAGDAGDASGRLAALLGKGATWSRVAPEVACTVHGLRHYADPPRARLVGAAD